VTSIPDLIDPQRFALDRLPASRAGTQHPVSAELAVARTPGEARRFPRFDRSDGPGWTSAPRCRPVPDEPLPLRLGPRPEFARTALPPHRHRAGGAVTRANGTIGLSSQRRPSRSLDTTHTREAGAGKGGSAPRGAKVYSFPTSGSIAYGTPIEPEVCSTCSCHPVSRDTESRRSIGIRHEGPNGRVTKQCGKDALHAPYLFDGRSMRSTGGIHSRMG